MPWIHDIERLYEAACKEPSKTPVHQGRFFSLDFAAVIMLLRAKHFTWDQVDKWFKERGIRKSATGWYLEFKKRILRKQLSTAEQNEINTALEKEKVNDIE